MAEILETGDITLLAGTNGQPRHFSSPPMTAVRSFTSGDHLEQRNEGREGGREGGRDGGTSIGLELGFKWHLAIPRTTLY